MTGARLTTHRTEAPPVPAPIEQARTLLARASRIVVLSGAGISAESGVPTFRGNDGLWRSFRAEELATPEAFARDPRLVWEWYGWRREKIATCEPNAAHLALARLALERAGVRIITQNVDGLHADAARRVAADLSSREPGGGAAPATPHPGMPLELHGSIFRTRCTRCGARVDHRGPIDAGSSEGLPHCGRCSALLRLDIVWFGESLDPAIIDEAFDLAASADVCLVVGTSAVVQPAASIASVTRAEGGAIIEVNPEPTPMTAEAAISIRGTAVETIGRLLG